MAKDNAVRHDENNGLVKVRAEISDGMLEAVVLMQGIADAGVTWKSEAIFQEQIGHPISDVLPISAFIAESLALSGRLARSAPSNCRRPPRCRYPRAITR
jgi:hypothetical protein